MPNFIRMKANASGHINITLDLSSYINAYEKAYGSQISESDDQTKTVAEFKKISHNIHKQLDGISGQIHWIDALEIATHNLEPSHQDAVAASPAARMMDNSFIEIIKNSMDECVTKYYDSNKVAKPCIQLAMDIDNTSNPEQVSIQITDSGRGFPDAFLHKVSTPSNRDTYVNTSRGSPKEKCKNRPPLFGGQGRGLRILIADEEGDMLGHLGQRIHRFTKPEISSVEFNNLMDINGHVQGAQITVTTSIEPREDLSLRIHKIKEQLQDNRRSNATPSPTDSVATTHESTSSRDSPPMLDLGFLDDEDQDEDFDDDNNFSP
ncbi:MAG: hypothetical protein P1U36_01730 [Legionellaceae bacterium]|nr:hypothetical protein [Legionellaceae bacterium]